MKQIFLNKNNGKRETNVDNYIGVDLVSDEKILPKDSISHTVDAYEEYVKEKDSSNLYRLIFTINPVCSNILFNANTEIVYKEGSNNCRWFKKDTQSLPTGNAREYLFYKGYSRNSTLTRKQMIEDTGFSHLEAGGFVYHCGADIFNNHTLRRKEFAAINKQEGTKKKEFNTLSDFLRDSAGKIIKEKILKIKNGKVSSGSTYSFERHLYTVDSVKTYQQTVNDCLIEDNGWVGFINPCSLNIPNYINAETEAEVCLNKCMNNNKAGEQIDMYPDRSLYSFIPKYNKYRNREEKNWEYCITYPSSNYYNEVVQNGTVNGLKCELLSDISGTIFDDSWGRGVKDEDKIVYLKTQVRNTFYQGSLINITVIRQGNISESIVPIRVEGIGYLGDDSAHIFSVNISNLFPVFAKLGNNFVDESGHLMDSYEIRVRRYDTGIDCQYYFRKFKKIDGSDTNSTTNKAAFSENIYSDKIAQIVFNNDIDTTGLKDNLGRGLSELYLTIVKNNKGNDLWYKQHNYTSKDVTFSHCFGKVTEGLDMDGTQNDYNVHKLVPRDVANVVGVPYCSPLGNTNGITMEANEFLGDIVEFSPYRVEETIIEEVYHRFNTYQREFINSEFDGIHYQEIKADDYDITSDFSVVEKTLFNNEKIHLNPEGYYYKAHYRVPIKQFNPTVKQGCHTKMIMTIISSSNSSYTANTAVNYYLKKDDKILLWNKKSFVAFDGAVDSVEGYTKVVFHTNATGDINDYAIFKANIEKPDYAWEMNDATGRYLWREPLSDKELIMGDELYNSIFTNGAHYFHKNINFYLRRQDPSMEGEEITEYGLNGKNLNNGSLDSFTGAADGKIKAEVYDDEYKKEDEGKIC